MDNTSYKTHKGIGLAHRRGNYNHTEVPHFRVGHFVFIKVCKVITFGAKNGDKKLTGGCYTIRLCESVA